MVAFKLENFGGMIPAQDSRLLPKNNAGLAQNVWLYSGAAEGFRTPTVVHTLANPLARKVYRVPKLYNDKDRIPDSFWLEFVNPGVDVISSPTANDQFERFYWASGQEFTADPPQYNTKARIAAGQPSFLLGVPSPSEAPLISRASGQYFLEASGATYTLRASAASIYYSRGYALDRETLAEGRVRDSAPELDGASTLRSTLLGNRDASPTPTPSNVSANTYRLSGSRAELRYTTVQNGLRVTISDAGVVTVGVPPQPTAGTSSEPYEGLGVLETRAYVYTWVTAYGEEGPPSPPTLYTGWSEDPWIVRLTAPTTGDTTDRNLSKVRVYRTITGTTGSTTYYLVTELDIGQTVYVDSSDAVTLTGNTILESTFWSAPPSDLEGMISMPNGIIAGWRENEIWFCEPYRPHAWPAPYTLAVEYPVIGLGVIGQSLIVCTTGSPYAISGVNPAAMSVSRLSSNEPCVSRGSVVSTQIGVIYASPNGLALAVPGSVQLITREMISKDLWSDPDEFLYLNSLRGALLNGGYYCWGSLQAGCFDAGGFDNDAFLQQDLTGAYTGAFIDPTNNRVAYVRLTNSTPTFNCFTDQWTGEVFLIRDGQVLWVDISNSRPHGSFTWRSKVLSMPNSRNLAALRVDFSTFPDTPALNPVQNVSPVQTLAPDQWGLVRVYADGVLRFTREIRVPRELMRLPSGFKANEWEIEIEARVKITHVEAATSASELRSV